MKNTSEFAIEGDFLENFDGLIFDVKGIAHPKDRITAYLRYIPITYFFRKLFHSSDLDQDKIIILKKLFTIFTDSANLQTKISDSDQFSLEIEKLNQILNIKIEDFRLRNGEIPYFKVYDIRSRFKILQFIHPSYIFQPANYDFPLQAVPVTDIKKIHKPDEFLNMKLKQYHNDFQLNSTQKLNSTQYSIQSQDDLRYWENLEKLVELLCGNDKELRYNVGLSGSLMVDLANDSSDYDLIVYGESASNKIRSNLSILLNQENNFPRKFNGLRLDVYRGESMESLFNSRAKGFSIKYDDFVHYESRKLHQFLINEIDVFIRFLKENREIYQNRSNFYKFNYKTLGRIEIIGKICDATDSIFTPAKYILEILRINNINLNSEFQSLKQKILSKILKLSYLTAFSLRGRFTEQAEFNEEVYLNGKLEIIYEDENFSISNSSSKLRIVLGADFRDLFFPIKSNLD